jgi:hypothetical protein
VVPGRFPVSKGERGSSDDEGGEAMRVSGTSPRLTRSSRQKLEGWDGHPASAEFVKTGSQTSQPVRSAASAVNGDVGRRVIQLIECAVASARGSLGACAGVGGLGVVAAQ